MTGEAFQLVLGSGNRKTGPIPVSTTSAETCPGCCPFKAGACYYLAGPGSIHWRRLNRREAGGDLAAFCAAIGAIPRGTLWRLNVAGDLPGRGNRIDRQSLWRIVEANRERRGFGFSHKPVLGRSRLAQDNRRAIAAANRAGMTIHISANNLRHADQLADLDIGPVAVVLPADVTYSATTTPAGRPVDVCPHYLDPAINCWRCDRCHDQDRPMVGFPAHGFGKAKASRIAEGF